MWIDEKGSGCENLMAGKSGLKGWLKMSWQREDLIRRSLARGPHGELLSWLTGNETEAEIRQMIVEIVLEFQYAKLCPLCNAHLQCPFFAMAGLSYHSMKELADTMPLEDCVKLFEMELACRASDAKSSRPPT
jgi:hypothetical protein